MSWKGFQKGVARVPQTVKQKFNIGEITKDPIYEDAERRFQHLEKETQKLHQESKRCFDSINNMLEHQLRFSEACEELYKPISGRPSDLDSFKQEGNPEGIAACERYQAIVRELQATLSPELQMIETRIIQPANELLEIIKTVRKTTLKRNHKQLDYDRHRATLKRLEEKKDKSLRDDKALYKAERDVEMATEEFEYYNRLLTEELPQLFKLERDFIQPLFESFYYMQLNVFYTLHEHMQQLRQIDYFDLTSDIEAGVKEKRGTIQEQVESLGIVRFKSAGGFRKGGKASALANRPALNGTSGNVENPPPPYSEKPAAGTATVAVPVAAVGTSATDGVGSSAWSAAAAAKAKKKPAPPPPKKPKPQSLGVRPAETVTALYDFAAQTPGDLSFNAGDVIDVVQRTQDENGWWTGRLNGREGVFPGNYVSLNQ